MGSAGVASLLPDPIGYCSGATKVSLEAQRAWSHGSMSGFQQHEYSATSAAICRREMCSTATPKSEAVQQSATAASSAADFVAKPL